MRQLEQNNYVLSTLYLVLRGLRFNQLGRTVNFIQVGAFL